MENELRFDKVLNIDQAASEMHMSKSWLQKHIKKGPKCYVVGGKYLWFRSDIMEWIKTRPEGGKPDEN